MGRNSSKSRRNQSTVSNRRLSRSDVPWNDPAFSYKDPIRSIRESLTVETPDTRVESLLPPSVRIRVNAIKARVRQNSALTHRLQRSIIAQLERRVPSVHEQMRRVYCRGRQVRKMVMIAKKLVPRGGRGSARLRSYKKSLFKC